VVSRPEGACGLINGTSARRMEIDYAKNVQHRHHGRPFRAAGEVRRAARTAGLKALERFESLFGPRKSAKRADIYVRAKGLALQQLVGQSPRIGVDSE
jgi:hypothetical protein